MKRILISCLLILFLTACNVKIEGSEALSGSKITVYDDYNPDYVIVGWEIQGGKMYAGLPKVANCQPGFGGRLEDWQNMRCAVEPQVPVVQAEATPTMSYETCIELRKSTTECAKYK